MGDLISTKKKLSTSSLAMEEREDNEKKRVIDDRRGSLLVNLPLPYGSRSSLISTVDSKNNNYQRKATRGHFQLLRQLSIPCDLDKSARYGRKTSVSLGIFSKTKKNLRMESKGVDLPTYLIYEYVIEPPKFQDSRIVVPCSRRHEHDRSNFIRYRLSTSNLQNTSFAGQIVDRDSFCTICERKAYLLKERVHGCRICDRIFHESCLRREGLCLNGLSAAALKESSSAIGWSCPECGNLFNLLTDDEKQELIDVFTNAANEGGIISRESFMVQRKYTYYALSGSPLSESKERLEHVLFDQMDRLQTGAVDWWDFVQPMSIRILSQRCPNDLLSALSQREVLRFKQTFQDYDKEKNGVIPTIFAQAAYDTWYQSITESSINLGTENKKRSMSMINRRKTFCYNDNRIRTCHWDTFIEKHALHVLSARPNTIRRKPFVPQDMSPLEMDFAKSRETLIE